MIFNRLITPYNRTVMKNKQNKYLVIHYVGAVSTAENNARYFYNANRGASAHYFVDENSIWQVVEDNDAAWHIGAKTYYNEARNGNSIGIEMCCKNNGEWYIEPETIENTLWLAANICNKYSIPIENVVRHYDCTRKNCPEPFVRDESKWIDFKSRLEKMMETSIENETDALQYLTEDGVISNVDYWNNALPYYKNLNYLLIKFANRLKELKAENGLK